jgi:hypothetical protein
VCQKRQESSRAKSEKHDEKNQGGTAENHTSTEVSNSYFKEIENILKIGLKQESIRYATETRLIRWCYATGKSEDEAYELIEDWYHSGKTNGFSKDWFLSAKQVLRALKLHIITFYRWLKQRWCDAKKDVETEPLTTADVRRILEECEWDIHRAQWLYDCLKWAKARRRYHKHLYLSAKIMRTFKNGRDAMKKYVPLLVAKGLLTCVDGRYYVDERCRIWQVDWEFSKQGKVVPASLTFREALVLVVTEAEIKAHYSKVSAWRVNRLRKNVAGLTLEDASTPKETSLNPSASACACPHADRCNAQANAHALEAGNTTPRKDFGGNPHHRPATPTSPSGSAHLNKSPPLLQTVR